MNQSFMLYRTNPKLAGNIKLVVGVGGSCYLNPLVPVGRLASDQYSNFKIDTKSTHSSNLRSYLKGLSRLDLYSPYERFSNLAIYDDFDKQYEFQYNYGVSKNHNKSLNGRLNFFAPLWLGDEIPDAFIILRIKGPVESETVKATDTLTPGNKYVVYGTDDIEVVAGGSSYYKGDIIYPSGATKFSITKGSGEVTIINQQAEADFLSMLDRSNIVHQATIRGSGLGDYLNNHIGDYGYQPYTFYTDYLNKEVKYSGIDYEQGIMAESSQFIGEMFDQEAPISHADEFITNGLERKGLLSSNLFNLEFNFDDELADDYHFNRYFGFYVNYREMFSSGLDLAGMFGVGGLYDVPYKPNLRAGIPNNDNYILSDANGVSIRVEQPGGGVIPTSLESGILYSIKSSSGSLHLLGEASHPVYKLRDTSINMSLLSRIPTDSILQRKASKAKNNLSSLSLTINELFEQNDALTLMVDGVAMQVVCDALPNMESFGAGDSLYYYFSPDGGVEAQLKSLCGAINWRLSDKMMRAIPHGENSILIFSTVGGDYSGRLSIEPGPKHTSTGFLGGSGSRDSVVVISSTDAPTPEGLYAYVDSGYAKVASIGPNLTSPVLDAGGVIVGFNDIGDVAVVVSGSNIKVVNGAIRMGTPFKLSVGGLSILPFKDMEFSLNPSRDYINYGVHEYYKYFYANNHISAGVEYEIRSPAGAPADCVVEYDGNEYLPGDRFVGVSGIGQVTTISGSPVILDVRYLGDEEVESFFGFHSIRDGSLPQPDLIPMENRYQSLNIQVNEYGHFYEESNQLRSTVSRVVPWINKWHSEDLDVRGRGHRFNLSTVFGDTDFSPSIDLGTPDQYHFTNEWFYMAGLPRYFDRSQAYRFFPYIGKEFSMGDYLRTDVDYFSVYMLVNEVNYLDPISGQPQSLELDNKVNWVTIRHDYANNYSCYFKGVRLRLTSDEDISGYKYSHLLQVKTSSQYVLEPPISIKVIKNDDHKNILVLISLKIDDYKLLGTESIDHEYSYMYMMDSLKSLVGSAGSYAHRLGKRFLLPAPLVELKEELAGGGYSTNPVIDFYGYQLYNRPINGSSAANNILFGGNIPFDKFYIPSAEFDRLIAMSEGGFLAATSQNGYISQSSAVFNRPNTVLSVNGTEVALANLGMMLFQLPTAPVGTNHSPQFINSSIFPLSSATWFIENGGNQVYSHIAKLLTTNGLLANISTNRDNICEYETISNGEVIPGINMNISGIRPHSLTIGQPLSAIKRPATLRNTDVINISYENKGPATKILRYDHRFIPKMYDIIKFSGLKFSMNWANADFDWDQDYPFEPPAPFSPKIWSTLGWHKVTGLWVTDPNNKYWITGYQPNDEYGLLSGLPSIEDFVGGNYKFIINEHSGWIRDIWYHKVDVRGTYRSILENPVYPGVELAIDRRDMNITTSDWSPNFSINHDGVNTKSYVDGNALNEDISGIFMGSVISLPRTITVNQFTGASLSRSPDGSIGLEIPIKDALVNALYELVEPQFKLYSSLFEIRNNDYAPHIRGYVEGLVTGSVIKDISIMIKSDQGLPSDKLVEYTDYIALLGRGFTRAGFDTTGLLSSSRLSAKIAADNSPAALAISVTISI